MKYDGRKIANSFYLPKRPFWSGVASLLDFTGARRREFEKQVLERSAAESMRLDWEAVAQDLCWAIAEYEKKAGQETPCEPDAEL